MPERWSQAEMENLAASAVSKVDLMGNRGTTLVTSDEIEAMAAVIVVSGVLPPVAERMNAGTYPEFRTTRKVAS